MMKIVLVDNLGKPIGIKEEEFDKNSMIPGTILLRTFEKDLFKNCFEYYIDEYPKQIGEIDIKIEGEERELFGIYYIKKSKAELIVGYKENESQIKEAYDFITRCEFSEIDGKCYLRKKVISCDERKLLGECPIEKGISESSIRAMWGIWLDYGGDKNVDFMSLHLSDFTEDMLKEINRRSSHLPFDNCK